VYNQLGTIINCKNIYWIALVLDFHDQVIWYGDSLDWEMDAEVMEVLAWCIKKYTTMTFKYKKMIVTYQNDTFSCGLLAWNALAHFFLPESQPLIPSSDVAIARLHVLLHVCERHQNQVGDLQSGSKHLSNALQGPNQPDNTFRYVVHPPDLVTSLDQGDSDFEMSPVYAASGTEAHLQAPGSESAGHLGHGDDTSSLSTSNDYDTTSNNDTASDDDTTSNDESTSADENMSEASDVLPPAGSTKVVSSSKIKSDSSVRTALGVREAYFKKCSCEEYYTNLAREKEIMQ
jgi:hypothetical protein